MKGDKIKMGDIMRDFWGKWLSSDMLIQTEMLEKLGLVEELADNGFPDLKDKTPEEQIEFRNHMLCTLLYGYLDDLRWIIEEDHENEMKKLKNEIISILNNFEDDADIPPQVAFEKIRGIVEDEDNKINKEDIDNVDVNDNDKVDDEVIEDGGN